MDVDVDFLAVVEHRLIPVRVRNEYARLRTKDISSAWAPTSQESSHAEYASWSGTNNCHHTIQVFFDMGCAVRCLLPIGGRRFMHLAVLYGIQGSDGDAVQLGLTDQLFNAALGELAAVARGQLVIIVGDFNAEPTKVPCLSKGISAGLWIDLEAAWADVSGVAPAITCKRSWNSGGVVVIVGGTSWWGALLLQLRGSLLLGHREMDL